MSVCGPLGQPVWGRGAPDWGGPAGGHHPLAHCSAWGNWCGNKKETMSSSVHAPLQGASSLDCPRERLTLPEMSTSHQDPFRPHPQGLWLSPLWARHLGPHHQTQPWRETTVVRFTKCIRHWSVHPAVFISGFPTAIPYPILFILYPLSPSSDCPTHTHQAVKRGENVGMMTGIRCCAMVPFTCQFGRAAGRPDSW